MSEDAFVSRCQTFLFSVGIRANESVMPNGVWLISGSDAAGMPFFAGRPEGRAASWRQACIMNGVPVPTGSVSEGGSP